MFLRKIRVLQAIVATVRVNQPNIGQMKKRIVDERSDEKDE